MASCPNCGFDLSPSGSCPVCGFGSAGMADAPSGREKGQTRGSGENPPGSSRRADRSAAHLAGHPAEHDANRQRGTASLFRRERLPWLLGGAALVVLIVVGFVVSRSAESPSGLQPTAVAPAPTNGPPVAGAASGGSAAGTTAATVSSAAASESETNGSASSAPATRASDTAREAAGKTASAPRSGTLTAQEIYAQEYSIPVGASPVNVRATHPVDLYNPAVEPVYNIDQLEYPPLTSEQAYVDWMLAHTNQSASLLRERWQRAAKALERHLVVHRRVLMAFLLTPREWFVRSYNLARTYENTALPIGYGQTISGPDLVMHMTDALDPQPNQRVLEIGTGSGYQSGVLSQLSNYVYTIEIVKPLAEQTNQIYLDHTKAMPELGNIHRRLADGYYGWPRYAPFDRIIVTTGIDHIPPILLQELKPGGIMVIPIGPPTGQTILKITKTVGENGTVHLTRTDLYPGITQIFVPFTASGGGTHNEPSTPR